MMRAVGSATLPARDRMQFVEMTGAVLFQLADADQVPQLRTAGVQDVNVYLNACRAMLRLADEPMMSELGAIDCPTMVLVGELEHSCPPRASAMITDAIPGAELTVIPGAGHCLHFEAPDITNGLILEFIERQR